MNNPNWKNRTMWTGDNLDVMRGMNSESAVEKSTGRFLQGGDMKPIAGLLIVCLMVMAACLCYGRQGALRAGGQTGAQDGHGMLPIP